MAAIIHGCTFESNQAYSKGGAAYFDNYYLSIQSNFTSNKSDNEGGALFFDCS